MSKQKSRHELLDDIEDLQEISKKWLNHKGNNYDNEDEDDQSSKLVETETDDDRISQMISQPEMIQQSPNITQQFQQQMFKKSQNTRVQFDNNIQHQQEDFSEYDNQSEQQQYYGDEDQESQIQEYEQKNYQYENDSSLMEQEQNLQQNKQNFDEDENLQYIQSQQFQSDLNQSSVSMVSQSTNQQKQQYKNSKPRIDTGLQKKSTTTNSTSTNNNKFSSTSVTNSTKNNLKDKKSYQNPYAGTNKPSKQVPKNDNQQSFKRNHNPQIIDEDTEHFKVQLDHLINVFKTDAVTEFMGMKKSMLEDQRFQVKQETQKYVNMYEEKSQELQETKQCLAEQIQENETMKTRYEGFAQLCGKAKERFRLQKSLGNYFNTLKLYKNYKEQKKQKKKMADYMYNKNLKKRMFNIWEKQYIESKHESDKQKSENIQLEEIQEITAKYNMELAQLRKKLQETEMLLDVANNDKVNLQDNLKKAFMRGVCALNFEAMNILGGNNKEESIMNQDQDNNQKGGQTQQQQEIIQNTQNITKTINNMDLNINNNNINKQFQQSYDSNENAGLPDHVSQSSFTQSQLQNDQNDYDQQYQNSTINSQQQSQMQQDKKKTIVYYQQPKIESKDHKWRDAPVVGVQRQNNNNSLNDKENDSYQQNQQSIFQQSSLPDFVSTRHNEDVQEIKGIQQNNDQDEDEREIGRVIRVTQQKQGKYEGIKSRVNTGLGSSANKSRNIGKPNTISNNSFRK